MDAASPPTTGSSPPRPRAVALESAVVLALGLVAALALTWPLALDLDRIAHNPVDGPFQAWTIDHVQWALTGGRPLWDATIFAPNQNTLAYSDNLLGVAVPLLPLRWLGLGPLAQLNVALLLGIATSAVGGYLVGRVVCGGRTAAVVAAAAFAFGPFGTGATSHLHTAFHGGIGLAAATAWWLADRARAGRSLAAPATALALSLSWSLTVSFYPGTYAVVTALVVMAVRTRHLGRRGVLAALAGFGTAALVALALALPYLEVLEEGREVADSRADVADLGVDLLRSSDDLVLLGPILGTEDGFPPPSFPGVTLLALAAVGLVAGLRGGGGRSRTAVALALALVAVGLLLGLGTAPDGWRSWSPYGVLFDQLPPVRVLRGAARAWVIGVLGLGLLAGWGAVVIGRAFSGGRRRRRGAVAVAAIGVLGIMVEGLAPWTDEVIIEYAAVDLVLADDPRDGGVLYLPALLPDGPLELATTFGQVANVFAVTAHHRRTPNGYSGISPQEWPALSERMLDLPSTATLEELRETGVRFVVVREEARGTPWEPLLEPAAAAPLDLQGRFEGDVLYEVPAGGAER